MTPNEQAEMEIGMAVQDIARAVSRLQDKAITAPELVSREGHDLLRSANSILALIQFVDERKAA